MSTAIYKENRFFYLLEPMQYTLKILPWILFSSSGCSRQQTHSLCVALAWFDIAHKNTKMCLLTDRLLLCFCFRYPQDKKHVLAQNGKVEDQPWPRVNKYACKTRSLGKDDVTLSGLARPGRSAFVSKWRLRMRNFRLLWRHITWDRMHFRGWNFGE